MKRIWIVVFAFALVGSAMSQTSTDNTYTYREILDDPYHVADKMISVEFCGPVTFSKNASISMGVAVNGLWAINNKLQIQSNFDFMPIRFKGGIGIGLEGGGAFTLSEKTKEKEARVVLKWSDRSYDTPTHHVRETSATWLNATATYLSQFKARGGAYLYKTTYRNEKEHMALGPLPYTMAGVYAGIELNKQAALVSEVDGQPGITSGLTRIYVDALLLPLRSFGATDVGGTIRSTIGGGILGGRFGFQATFNPNKSKKSKLGRLNDYQVYPKFFFKTEVGYRPAEGTFFTLGGGFVVWKNR
jgi:hypothetical protein